LIDPLLNHQQLLVAYQIVRYFMLQTLTARPYFPSSQSHSKSAVQMKEDAHRRKQSCITWHPMATHLSPSLRKYNIDARFGPTLYVHNYLAA
jgi:hypothetical protein